MSRKILTAGTVITMDPARPRVRAVAVSDGRIVDPDQLADKATVSGTWLSGERIDLDAFVTAVSGSDPGQHAHLADEPRHTCC